jgi:transcriptional regulator GlxA family with amidase domain
MGAYNMGYTPNEAELAFVRKAYDESTAFLTICGGFQAAHLAGLLVGKMATAPRFMLEELKKQDPRTTWVDRRFVRDGKLWTSGALLNGQDLIRAFTMEHWPQLGSICLPVGGWPVRSAEYEGSEGLVAGQAPMVEAK